MKHTFVKRKLSAGRKYDLPMENDQAYIDSFLEGAHYDAWKEIAEAFTLQTYGMGYATQDLNKVSGAYNDNDDLSPYQQQLLDTLREFKKEVGKNYGLCIDLVAGAAPLEDMCKRRGAPKSWIVYNVINCLDAWNDLRGLQ